MTALRLLSVLLAASALACGSAPNQAARPPESAGQPSAAAMRRQPDANTVTVDDAMLRDLRITLDEVESRTGGEQSTLLGELAVDQRAYAELGVPMPSRVTRLLVQVGEGVEAGQIVAELTSPELATARAEYLSARARVTLADAALERKRGLAAEKILPLREVQEAEAAAAEARGGQRSARAILTAFGAEPPADDADGAVSPSFVLRSPIAGVVIDRTVVLGAMVEPATPAFLIGNLSTLWLTVHAFERDAVRIERGVGARVVFPALPGREFRGVVNMVGRQVHLESRTVPVRIDVRNAGGVLRPGMSATAILPVGGSREPILTVPVAAVQRVRNAWCVFLPKDPSSFEIRPIGRGRDLAGEVEVLSGLRAGERIVVDGAFLLKAQAERAEADHDAH